jgi:hypothetical protein
MCLAIGDVEALAGPREWNRLPKEKLPFDAAQSFKGENRGKTRRKETLIYDSRRPPVHWGAGGQLSLYHCL